MPSSKSNATLKWDSEITSPFDTLTRQIYPRTVSEVFAWAEELWMHHGLYSQAIKKAVRYFLTEIEFSGDDDSSSANIDKYKELFEDKYDLLQELACIGDDFIAFGNSFTSMHVPFTRALYCPKCFLKAPLNQMTDFYKWSSTDMSFKGKCPSCSLNVTYIREDNEVSSDKVIPVINKWPPQYMEIKKHILSHRTDFYLNVNDYDELRTGIMQGDTMYLEDTPWEIIEAVVKNQKFKFAEGQVFHMANPGITSMEPTLRGWGLPMFMAEFETAILIHMLDKYTESLLVDHLMPFKVLSPPKAAGPMQDPMLQMDMADFSSQVMQMLTRHSKNPTDWNFLPTPLEYQVLGGDAAQFIPTEIQEFYEQRLLHSMGIAPEFYKGGAASSSAGPILTFKMFENVWQHFANNANNWLTWVANRQGEIMNWESISAKLVPSTLYDDPEVRTVKLSLAASNEISRETAYRPLGINVRKERKKIQEEQRRADDDAEAREKELAESQAGKDALKVPSGAEAVLMSEEQAAAGAGGGMPPGMPPPSGAPEAGMGSPSVDDLWSQAEEQANAIVAMPPPEREAALRELGKTNESLHALTKKRVAQLDAEAEKQGRAMLSQGGAPPM